MSRVRAEAKEKTRDSYGMEDAFDALMMRSRLMGRHAALISETLDHVSKTYHQSKRSEQ